MRHRGPGGIMTALKRAAGWSKGRDDGNKFHKENGGQNGEKTRFKAGPYRYRNC